MGERADLLRVDATGTIHPLGRDASHELRAHAGDWRLLRSPSEVLLLRVAESKSGAVLKLAGELRSPGALYDVIALAAQSGWRGELIVYSELAIRSIFIDGGSIVSATTNLPQERLGETLYRFGVVTREQLETAVRVASESGKRLGEAAIELEFVTPEELYPMMARQVEEVFFRALQVSDGVFFFFDRFEEAQLVRRHNMNAAALLMEAARRMDEMRFFREKVPNDTFIPVPSPSTPARTGTPVPDECRAVYEECDGKRSIAEIGRRIGQLEFEVTRAVFQLVNGGFVTVLAPRPAGPAAIMDAFNPALAEIHRACDAVGKLAELRDGLSRFATGAGVYDPLFSGAGPQPDGTMRPDRLERNFAVLAGDEPDSWLVTQLYEYVGFALFQAGSLLPRAEETNLNARVAEILKPLRQLETATASPASRKP